MSPSPVTAWICSVCGYVHYGPEPPSECPVCGAAREAFEPSTEALPTLQMASESPASKVVIIGAGIAGVSAAEALRKAAPQAEIVLVSDEALLPYYRLNLTRYLAGEVSAEQLTLHPESWYTELGIQLLRETELNSIDLPSKEVTLKDQTRLSFDKLILTVGSRPFVPPFPGADKQGVTTLRTRQDADRILAVCRGTSLFNGGMKVSETHLHTPNPQKIHCVCIGGGLLGLETAGALACQGVRVSVLESQPWLLPRQLNESASRLFLQQVETLGISVHSRAKTVALVGEEAIRGVLLEDGTLLPAELVVISAGVRSNIELARRAGLQVNQGILVDDCMQTSHPDVYAAGDLAEHRGVLYGTWVPSQAQGTAAGLSAAGQTAEFKGLPRSNTLKVLGIDLFSIGQIEAKDPADLLVESESDDRYFGFIFHHNHLAGSILLGDTSLSAKVKQAIEEQVDFSIPLARLANVSGMIDFLREV